MTWSESSDWLMESGVSTANISKYYKVSNERVALGMYPATSIYYVHFSF